MLNYKDIQNRIEALDVIQGVDLSIIGYSLLNKPIYAIHLGNYDGPQMIMEGGIHAREYLSTLFLIEEIKYLATKDIINGGIYVVPMVNPDGIELVLNGTTNLPCDILRRYLLDVNNNNPDFSQWKANANAVDLNVNFDASWGEGTQNVFCPSSGNFVGYYPESEREINNLIRFTKEVNPSITISWHTKGEVIYYGFKSLSPEDLMRDYNIALSLSAVNGYPVIKTEGSVGGYSDYISLVYNVPAYTIEIGNGALPHPIGEEYLMEVFEQNKNVPIVALENVGGKFFDESISSVCKIIK